MHAGQQHKVKNFEQSLASQTSFQDLLHTGQHSEGTMISWDTLVPLEQDEKIFHLVYTL